jgi:hypothetical protein
MSEEASEGTARQVGACCHGGSWSREGGATFSATGEDPRSALEAGLRAVLALARLPATAAADGDRAAPIHGEGADLVALFVLLAADLLDQIAEFGASLRDVTIDGLLTEDDGTLRAWGYVHGALTPASPSPAPLILSNAAVTETPGRIEIHGVLRSMPKAH